MKRDLEVFDSDRLVWKKDAAPVRRFRIWDDSKRRNLAHRCYATLYRATRFALVEVHFSAVGSSLTVYDVKDGLDIFTFKHHADGAIGVVLGKKPPRKD